MNRVARFVIPGLLVWMIFTLLVTAAPARADGVSFQLSSISLPSSSNGVVTFTGSVTNSSGRDLTAGDFFFNFSGYDVTSVNPIQDLGVTTNFSIPNGHTSATVALFDVMLGIVPPGSAFPIQVQLEDSNFDLSGVQTVTVSVRESVATPEPATLLLVGSGLAAVLAKRQRHKR